MANGSGWLQIKKYPSSNMISRSQQILLQRAKREAGLCDDDYRDALELIAGCRSSKSPAMTDRHLDKLLAYFEAILWRAVDAGTLRPSCSATAVFRQRGFWAARNTNAETSRDRYIAKHHGRTVADLEADLAGLGFDQAYCAAIRRKVTHGRDDAHALQLYRCALERTLKAKANAKAKADTRAKAMEVETAGKATGNPF